MAFHRFLYLFYFHRLFTSNQSIFLLTCSLILFHLEAQNVPFKFSIVPDSNVTVVQNQMVLFRCLASRTRNIEYVWKHNNEEINFNHRYSMVNGRSLRIIKAILKNSGKYTCIARDKTTNEEISVSSFLLVRGNLYKTLYILCKIV